VTAELASVQVIRRQVFITHARKRFTLVLDQLQSGLMNQSAVSKHWIRPPTTTRNTSEKGCSVSLGAAPPCLTPESGMQALFREEAARLEHQASGWLGLFLCSAFVVEAVKGATP
jgi:hypothetical protein